MSPWPIKPPPPPPTTQGDPDSSPVPDWVRDAPQAPGGPLDLPKQPTAK
jgi:hypothetical protein